MRGATLVWPFLLFSLYAESHQPVIFEEVTGSTIRLVLRNSATPEKHQIETMPGGVALFDFDNDGLLDAFFTNGARQPELKKADPSWHNRLYRNLGNWRFENVTERAGLAGEGYSMGAAAADYDNDGFTDLFVTGVRGNKLYRNRGDGTFAAVPGFEGSRAWSIAAAWFDYDRDGHLDVFVVNYVKWDPATEPFCGDAKRTYRTYCHPTFYEGLPNLLYRNNGDGTFTDVSLKTGIAKHVGKGMGIAIADGNVIVANDTTPNFLFRNDGGTFTEVGMQAGIGMNDDGRALSSMGVDYRDIDNDGKPDIFVTALANETFPLYRNAGNGLFVDVTYPSRIGAATMPLSGWGAGAFDFDNDGFKDLFAANGDVQDNTELFSSRASRQKNLVLRNDGKNGFLALPIGTPALHRGAAFGDLDNDGRVDVVVTRLNEAPLLLRNATKNRNHWLGLKLIGKRSTRDAIGARIRVGSQWNHVTTSVGYASSSDKRVHFGLAAESFVDVEIEWPSGAKQRLESVKAGHYLEVREP